MSLLDALPLALLGAMLGLDVVSFPQAMLSRPIVAATVAGAIVGDAAAGLLVGVALELIALETLPVGASRYPEWGSASVVGGDAGAAHFSLHAEFIQQPAGGGVEVVVVVVVLTQTRKIIERRGRSRHRQRPDAPAGRPLCGPGADSPRPRLAARSPLAAWRRTSAAHPPGRTS